MAAHFGSIPVGVVDTRVVALVDPLPEDHLLEGLVWEEQAYHLYGGGGGRMWSEWSMHEAGNGGREEGRKWVHRRKEGELEMEGVEGRGNGGALNGLDNNKSRT